MSKVLSGVHGSAHSTVNKMIVICFFKPTLYMCYKISSLHCVSSLISGVRKFFRALSIFGNVCLKEALVTWPLSASGLYRVSTFAVAPPPPNFLLSFGVTALPLILHSNTFHTVETMKTISNTFQAPRKRAWFTASSMCAWKFVYWVCYLLHITLHFVLHTQWKVF